MQEQHTVSTHSHLELGHRWSNQHHLVLGTVNLQFHGWFVSIALKPTLGIVAAHVLVTIWLSC